jgi:hypothetical protein
MKIQSSNYIPVNRFSRNDLIKEQISNNKEIIKTEREIISNNNKLIDTLEKGLAELAPFKAYCIEQLRLNANTAYNSNNSISSEVKKIDNLHNQVKEFDINKTNVLKNNKQDVQTPKVNTLDNKTILRESDLRLELGNTKEAIKGYEKIISQKENKPVEANYKPIEEKLRQSSKLYMEFQPLIDKLNISKDLKMNLYCAGISAHTNEDFYVSKFEVLHMIKNQFFYPDK